MKIAKKKPLTKKQQSDLRYLRMMLRNMIRAYEFLDIRCYQPVLSGKTPKGMKCVYSVTKQDARHVQSMIRVLKIANNGLGKAGKDMPTILDILAHYDIIENFKKLEKETEPMLLPKTKVK